MGSSYLIHNFEDRDPIEVELKVVIPYDVAKDMTLSELEQFKKDLMQSTSREATRILKAKGL